LTEEEEALVRLREIVAGPEIEPEAVVLDVGAGTGVLLPLLLKEEGEPGCGPRFLV